MADRLICLGVRIAVEADVGVLDLGSLNARQYVLIILGERMAVDNDRPLILLQALEAFTEERTWPHDPSGPR